MVIYRHTMVIYRHRLVIYRLIIVYNAGNYLPPTLYCYSAHVSQALEDYGVTSVWWTIMASLSMVVYLVTVWR